MEIFHYYKVLILIIDYLILLRNVPKSISDSSSFKEFEISIFCRLMKKKTELLYLSVEWITFSPSELSKYENYISIS